MAKVELKQPIVEEIANSIKDAQSVVLVNYSGLTVEQDTILRKELREAGVLYDTQKSILRMSEESGLWEPTAPCPQGFTAENVSPMALRRSYRPNSGKGM